MIRISRFPKSKEKKSLLFLQLKYSNSEIQEKVNKSVGAMTFLFILEKRSRKKNDKVYTLGHKLKIYRISLFKLAILKIVPIELHKRIGKIQECLKQDV